MADPLASPVQERIWNAVPAKIPLYAKLLVAGGGLSGCAAALTAARSGVSVTLLEPTHMLGGQAGPAGVSAMDVTEYYSDMINPYGFWHEFRSRIIDFYRYRLRRHVNVSQYRDQSFSPNPIVVDRVLTQMLKEAGVRVIRNVRIESATIKPGVAKVVTSSGSISAVLVVDATEDGTIIRTSGMPHRLGHSVLRPDGYSRPKLSKVAVQAITQTAMIRRYEPGTMPEELRIKNPPRGYEEYLPTIKKGYPFGPGNARQGLPNGFAGYRGAPDLAGQDYQGSEWEKITRTSLNYLNDQPVPASYFTRDDIKARFERLAIEKTLSVLYYLQNEIGLDWSVVTDEGFADGPTPRDPRITRGFPEAIVRHLPPIVYQRESARLVGRTTMTGKSIFRRANRTTSQWDSSAIAVGTYPPDLHGGRLEEDLEIDLGETLGDKPAKWREGPFPVPLGSLVPTRPVPLIAAEKNISASRIAASAVRLHPTVCAVGQSAGALAALALIHDVPPSRVPTVAVQAMVLHLGAHLTHYPVSNLSRHDPDYAAVQLAITHGLVDTTETPQRDSSPLLQVDRERAARLGQLLLEEYLTWTAPALKVDRHTEEPSNEGPLN